MIDRIVWDEITLDVVAAAKQEIAVKDFEMQCRLAPVENGKSYFDRIRVAESLIREKILAVEDGHLKLPNNHVPESIMGKLLGGSEVAWKILDIIDPPKKIIRKLDQTLLSKIGLDGEFAVIRELNDSLHKEDFEKVRHVSQYDDSAGFDIQSPSLKSASTTTLLEVKTSVRPGDVFTFFISKNEARVGRQNSNWFLVGVEPFEGGYRVFGHISSFLFIDMLPVDQGDFCEWDTARVSLSKQVFFQGLP
jgi:hypothetical protein